MKRVKKVLAGILACCMLLCLLPATAMAVETDGDSGTFSVATLNVDGLPIKILNLVTLNGNGPGSDGSKKISEKLYEKQWDIVAVQEDFDYNTEITSKLTNYSQGTHRGRITGLTNKTDGLNLFWKNSINVTGESWTSWTSSYSTGIFNTGNGADGMIDKGYRYYKAEIAPGVVVDVYTFHMDADSDQGDIDARENQWTQFTNAVLASDNKNPIIVMGDTNSRYTREQLETKFMNPINADERFTVGDAWVDLVRDGYYPTYGTNDLYAGEGESTHTSENIEVVDKVFFINNADSDVIIVPTTYEVVTDFTNEEGELLADHYPVAVNFFYLKLSHEHDYAVTSITPAGCETDGLIVYTCTDPECGETSSEAIPATGHSYDRISSAATCTTPGISVYTCAHCGNSYEVTEQLEEHNYQLTFDFAPTCVDDGIQIYTCPLCRDSYNVIQPAAGHWFEDGMCQICGELDPNWIWNDEEDEIIDSGMTLGSAARSITNGNQYTIVFQSAQALSFEADSTLSSTEFYQETGDSIAAKTVWTVRKSGTGYTISATINGTTKYLSRTKTLTNGGYKLELSNQPFVWTITMNSTKRTAQITSKVVSSQYSLKYYSSKIGWVAANQSADLKLYEVNE